MGTATGESLDVVVIGAGQAGLAAAWQLRHLRHHGFSPTMAILDANPGPGGAWRHRWDSLTFDHAHGIADLPGMPLGNPDPHVPASQIVTDYYGRYEREFSLNVRRPFAVTSVSPAPDGLLRITGRFGTHPASLDARVIINATGTWTHPFVPWVPGIDIFQGRQLRTVDFRRADDFADQRVLVVGGGLSAVQFLLPIAHVARSTTWATRRPPNFIDRSFDSLWGIEVETAVRERTLAGQPPASVVRTTGIPLWPEYVRGVDDGVLVSRGMVAGFTANAARFDAATTDARGAEGLGPSAADRLVVPASWQPFARATEVPIDVVLWATGFRAALDHLAPLRLREPGGGIRMTDEVTVAQDPRVFLVGYGSSASTVGATRAGRAAGRAAARAVAAMVSSHEG